MIASPRGVLTHAGYAVLELALGETHRRSDKVYAGFDDDHENIGWYRATAAGATPNFHQTYTKTGLAWQAFIIGGLANLGLWAILVTAYRARKKRRRQAAA